MQTSAETAWSCPVFFKLAAGRYIERRGKLFPDTTLEDSLTPGGGRYPLPDY
ncbi:UNVERIFIED_ORG: hypothetical protein ABIB52_000556 [Arthrobacter sp. UYCu721]